jgi:hypothetical protein
LSSPAPPFPFKGVLILTNAGGTGKFDVAKGTETLKFAGQYLDANVSVGFVKHIETGKVTTP